MAVALRGSAVVPAGNPTTSHTYTIPASVVAGDVLYVAATSRDSTSASANVSCLDTDIGGNTWTAIANSADKKAWLFRKVATAGTAGKTITVGNCVGSSSGVLKCFSGVNTTTPETNVTLTTLPSGTELTIGFVPTNADSMLNLAVFNYANDNAITGPTTANFGAMTFTEKLSTGGNDCATMYAHDLATGSGSTGNFSWTQATNGTAYAIVWAIAPQAANHYTLPAEAGSFALTGASAGLARARTLVASSGAFSLTGTSNVLREAKRLVAAPGTYNLTGTAAGLARGVSMAAGSGAFSLTGAAVGLSRTRRLVASPGTFSLTGTAATLSKTRVMHATYSELFPPPGVRATDTQSEQITLSWQAPAAFNVYTPQTTITRGRRLTATAGSFTLTGTSVGIARVPPQLVANPPLATPKSVEAVAQTETSAYLTWDFGTSYQLTGGSVSFLRGYTLRAELGAVPSVPGGLEATVEGDDTIRLDWQASSHELFQLTGRSAAIRKVLERTLSADAGAFSLTGTDVALRTGRAMVAEAGTFTLTGLAVALQEQEHLAALAGAFALTGQDAILKVSRVLAAESGGYDLSGLSAALGIVRRLDAQPGAYSFTGQSASLGIARRLDAQSGAFDLTGLVAAFNRTRRLDAQPGTFVLTGQAAALVRPGSFVLIAGAGTFALTGQDAAFARTRNLLLEAGGFTLDGQAVTFERVRRLATLPGVFVLTGQSVGLIVPTDSYHQIVGPTGVSFESLATSIDLDDLGTGLMLIPLETGIDLE